MIRHYVFRCECGWHTRQPRLAGGIAWKRHYLAHGVPVHFEVKPA